MQFSIVSALLLAAASSVVAQGPTAHFDVLTVPAQGQVIPGGSSFTVEWQPNNVDGTVTLTLIQGAAANLLEKGPVLASGINNLDGKFIWNPVPNGGYAAYGLNISLDSDPSTYQLSNGFHISSAATTTKSTTVLQTTTVTLAPGPSYSAHTNTTSSAVWSTKHNISSTASANATWTKPTTLATASSYTLPALTTPSVPSSAPSSSQSASAPPTSGAAANMASGGLAMIGGLLLALAL